MAIAIHIVAITRPFVDGEPTESVVPKESVPNSRDGLTVDEYLEGEAADGYLPVVLSEWKIITASVSDVNGA